MINTSSRLRPRIEVLKAEVMARDGAIGPEQPACLLDVALWRAIKPGRSRVQVRAAFLREQVNLFRLQIDPGWRLAGDHLPRAVACWPGLDATEAETIANLAALGVPDDDVPELCRCVQAWRDAPGPGPGTHQWCSVGESEPDDDLGRGNWSDGLTPACTSPAAGRRIIRFATTPNCCGSASPGFVSRSSNDS